MSPPFVLHFETDFAHGCLSCPQGTPNEERYQLALDMQVYLWCDEGHSYQRDRWQVETWSMGTVKGGRN